MRNKLDISELTAPLGAVVMGVDTSKQLATPLQQTLRDALASHLLLIIRRQSLSPSELARFAAIFGAPVVHSFVPGLPDQASITEIRKEPEHQHNFGGAWHFDMSFLARPPIATVLLAKEIPTSGGDTLWSNQYRAYAALPGHLLSRIDNLSAEHTSQLAFGETSRMTEAALHPLAPVHPQTGRRYLYANPVSISRLLCPDGDDAPALLGHLYAHAAQPRFQYRHRWQVGDLLVWDNLAAMHRAMNDYPGQRRVMHRVVVSPPSGRH